MKTLKVASVGMLFLLLSVASMAAQNTMPDPNNASCWSSLAALHACQLQAYQQEQDYAQRCTSYPEYQCIPESVSMTKTSGKQAKPIATSAAAPNTTADSSTANTSANTASGNTR
ncbi:MAG: hypothetical protein WBW69_16035 [Candidatus Korobacteraceae bacterium]